MALIQFGGGVTAMSGSIAGNTFAKNRFGYYNRARTKPVNARSSLQVQRRTVLAFLAETWHEQLDAIERGAWETYAAGITTKNRLGADVNLTGFNHFIRSNSIRLLLGQPVIEAGPANISLPEPDQLFAITPHVADNQVSVVFDATAPYHIEALGMLVVFMGRPQLLTRNFFNGPWKYVGQIVHDDVSPKVFAAPFTMTLGQRVWCYSRVSRADSRLSSRVVKDAFVAA